MRHFASEAKKSHVMLFCVTVIVFFVMFALATGCTGSITIIHEGGEGMAGSVTAQEKQHTFDTKGNKAALKGI
jgi:hypothetical protein